MDPSDITYWIRVCQKLVFKTDYHFKHVKNIAECGRGRSAILSTFIKLPFIIQIFVFSIFEWPLKTGFTVYFSSPNSIRLSGIKTPTFGK